MNISGTATSMQVPVEPELPALRTSLNTALDGLDGALDRLARARARAFGARPEVVAGMNAKDESANGVLDSLRREISRLDRLASVASSLADDFERLV